MTSRIYYTEPYRRTFDATVLSADPVAAPVLLSEPGEVPGLTANALAALGTFSAFLLGSVVGIAVIVGGKGGRKTKVPFGPFMVIGTFLALFFGQAVVDWYAGMIGL